MSVGSQSRSLDISHCDYSVQGKQKNETVLSISGGTFDCRVLLIQRRIRGTLNSPSGSCSAMCLFDCPHSFDKMLDITEDVVQVPIARIPTEIVDQDFANTSASAFVSTHAHKVLTDVSLL